MGGGGGAGRPSPTLCESKQRVKQRREKEFGDHDQAVDLWLPAGPRCGKRRSHLAEICEAAYMMYSMKAVHDGDGSGLLFKAC